MAARRRIEQAAGAGECLPDTRERDRHPPTGSRSPMIRFLLRFLGLCLLATAFVFFVYDGTKSIANHDLVYTKVGDVWAIVDQTSLNLVQNWLKQKFAWAWDPYLQKGFDLPAWVVVGI